MTPSDTEIRALLLGGCEYARDCDKWCGDATKASCVSRNRVIEALQGAWRAGMEAGAVIAEAHREGDQYGTLPGTSSAGTEIAASIRSKAAALGGPLLQGAAGASGAESTAIPKAEWYKELPSTGDDGPLIQGGGE